MRGESVGHLAPPYRGASDARAVLAMTSAQARLADTIENFYNASDRTSDGAMAGHAFKSAVDDLDNSVQREMVCGRFASMGIARHDRDRSLFCSLLGSPVSYVYHGAAREDECVLSRYQRAYIEAEQKSAFLGCLYGDLFGQRLG